MSVFLLRWLVDCARCADVDDQMLPIGFLAGKIVCVGAGPLIYVCQTLRSFTEIEEIYRLIRLISIR